MTPPLDEFRDYSAAQNFFTASLADFLLSSLAHLLRPFSRKSDIPLQRWTALYTCMPTLKLLKNMISIKECTAEIRSEFCDGHFYYSLVKNINSSKRFVILTLIDHSLFLELINASMHARYYQKFIRFFCKMIPFLL